MQSISLQKLLQEIIALGAGHTPIKVLKEVGSRPIPWEQQFDLRSWELWDKEFVIHKNEIIEDGLSQEISLRGIFKQKTVIGYISLPVIAVTCSRVMPIGEWKELPDPELEFAGCFWYPTEIRYHKSQATLNELIRLDPLKKEMG